MGYRLHFCTEYVKKYSGTSCFNHNTKVINHLFYWLNERGDHSYDFTYNSDVLDCADEIDWQRAGVTDAIVILKDMIDTGKSWADIPIYGDSDGSPDWSIARWLRYELVYAEKHDGITPEYVYEFLVRADERSDKRNDYIHFEWF